MNKTQAKRLLKVAQALREAKRPKQFTMESYLNESSEWDEEQQDYVPGEFCGTPACAFGHYAARPDLQRLVVIKSAGDTPGYFHLAYRNGRHATHIDRKVLGHFGITLAESDQLFNADGCNFAQTPKQAAKYIEKFVKTRYPEAAL